MSENEKKVPKRRFKEFENAEGWEQRELGDISDVTKLAGFEFTEYVIYSDDGTIIALRGLNVKNGKIILDDVKYIDQSDFSKLNRSKLFKDDILFTYVGTVGELAIIPADNKYYLAPNVARIRLKGEVNSQFVIQMMGNKTYYDKVIFPLIATSSQPALSMENVRKFILKLPSFEEQTKIGEFFVQIDNLITLHQRKLDKMKALKKAYLTDMFPTKGERKPKLRFAGFTDDWEQRKLLDMLIQPITDGPHETPELVDKGITFISVDAIVDNRIDFTRKRGYITEKYNDQCCKKYKPQFHDVYLVKSGSTVGKTAIVETYERFNIWSPLAAMRCGEKSNPYFLYYLLQTKSLQMQVFDKCSHGTQPNLSMRQLEKFNVCVPNIEEQKRIGNFFFDFDNLITLHQRKLEKLQNIKKAYLNEMFI